jgi:poly(A) polymerase Pap1
MQNENQSDQAERVLKDLIKQFSNGKELPQLKDIVLVDQADVEIIKMCFMGMMIDISIGQVSTNIPSIFDQ